MLNSINRFFNSCEVDVLKQDFIRIYNVRKTGLILNDTVNFAFSTIKRPIKSFGVPIENLPVFTLSIQYNEIPFGKKNSLMEIRFAYDAKKKIFNGIYTDSTEQEKLLKINKNKVISYLREISKEESCENKQKFYSDLANILSKVK